MSPRAIDMTGQVFGRLTAIRRDGTYVSPRGATSPTWLCRCECGTEIVAHGGALRQGLTKSCGCFKRDQMSAVGSANHKGDDIEYRAAHHRVRFSKGPASNHPCVDCTSPAKEWSYVGDCPRERISKSRSFAGKKYSPDPDSYVARCVPCHQRYDRNQEAA